MCELRFRMGILSAIAALAILLIALTAAAIWLWHALGALMPMILLVVGVFILAGIGSWVSASPERRRELMAETEARHRASRAHKLAVEQAKRDWAARKTR